MTLLIALVIINAALVCFNCWNLVRLRRQLRVIERRRLLILALDAAHSEVWRSGSVL